MIKPAPVMWFQRPFMIVALLILAATLWACAPDQGVSVVPGESCRIAEDQKGSFMAPLHETTVEVVLDARFTENEKSALIDTISQWNTMAEKMGRTRFFSAIASAVPEKVRSADPRNCEAPIGGRSRFYVVKETVLSRWKEFGFTESIPGATVRCTAGAELVQQVIFINPKLVSSEQFATVALHEFGHSLGLDHSCIEGAGRQDYAGCSKLAENHPYRIAVMYPTISRASTSSTAETRDFLRRNDAQRTQCLYTE